jgi:hypothetical protein
MQANYLQEINKSRQQHLRSCGQTNPVVEFHHLPKFERFEFSSTKFDFKNYSHVIF